MRFVDGIAYDICKWNNIELNLRLHESLGNISNDNTLICRSNDNYIVYMILSIK